MTTLGSLQNAISWSGRQIVISINIRASLNKIDLTWLDFYMYLQLFLSYHLLCSCDFFIYTDVPGAVTPTEELNDNEITLQWEEPDNNGAAITQYSVYQRIGNDAKWTKLGTVTDTNRKYVVKVEKGKKDIEYEFAVTASNKYGESSKINTVTVKVPGGRSNVTSGFSIA